MPQKRERPRGLWKARVMPRLPATNHERQPPGSEFESDNDNDDASSASSSSSSQHCRSPSLESLSDVDFYLDYSRRSSPLSADPINNREILQEKMDVSSTAGPGSSIENPSFTYEDWEDLKELFTQATDRFENAEAAEALPIIRGVIHECHRFMLAYPDPSVLFTNPSTTHRISATQSVSDGAPSSILLSSAPKNDNRKDLSTAFHVILGSVLYMFGSIIAQEPDQAAAGEPETPAPYWLAALDVFETGENLPSRVHARSGEVVDDWQLAVVWGRTLVCIVEEIVTREAKASKYSTQTDDSQSISEFLAEDLEWPPESPFATIVNRRPPITRRMTLSSVTANDLLVNAMDHFSRGIFRMPHTAQQATHLLLGGPFSRARELFQIASEVLSVSEKLTLPTERHSWAMWADSVFNQMKMEADMDVWRGPINRARGRCWLVVGTARYDGFEAAMEESDERLTDSPEAREAREALLKAVAFFERAKSSAGLQDPSDPDVQELQELLAESLLTLGNLAPTEAEQEEYYARAKLEGGQDYLMDDNSDHSGRDRDGDEIMDDS